MNTSSFGLRSAGGFSGENGLLFSKGMDDTFTGVSRQTLQSGRTRSGLQLPVEDNTAIKVIFGLNLTFQFLQTIP